MLSSVPVISLDMLEVLLLPLYNPGTIALWQSQAASKSALSAVSIILNDAMIAVLLFYYRLVLDEADVCTSASPGAHYSDFCNNSDADVW